MKRFASATAQMLLVAVCLASSLLAADPGIPDTLRFLPDTLVVGESRPVRLQLVNDEVLSGIPLNLTISRLSGFARFDSLRWSGPLGDPSVLSFRQVKSDSADGQPDDQISLVALRIFVDGLYPKGAAVPAELFFTGLEAGVMNIDTAHARAGYDNKLEAYQQRDRFYPVVVPGLTVVRESTGLILSVETQNVSAVSGTQINIPVHAAPVSSNVSVTSFTCPDQPGRLPSSAPALTTGTDTVFSWTPGMNDRGNWVAVIGVCQNGACREDAIQIQIVDDNSHFLSMTVTETPTTVAASSLLLADMNGDGVDEVLASGAGLGAHTRTPFGSFRVDISGSCQLLDSLFPTQVAANMCSGYFDGDDDLDLIFYKCGTVQNGISYLFGNGNGTFEQSATTYSPSANVSENGPGVLAELTGDAGIDYVTSRGTVFTIRALDSPGSLEHSTFQRIDCGDTIRSMQAVDLNSDDRTDLVVGLTKGLQIYRKTDSNFVAGSLYPYNYGAVDLDITNQTSDLNADGISDLVIATPSVGGQFSEVRSYLGNGDGTLTPKSILQIAGQVFATTLGDFNADGVIDAAYVNGSKKYAGILYGDGTGEFTDEIRFSVPGYHPKRIAATDFDHDGDVDLLVSSYDIPDGASLLVYKNLLNPAGVGPSQTVVSVANNAELEIVTPAGRVMNRSGSTISASSRMERRLDDNALIDAQYTLGVIEAGSYEFHARPRKSLAVLSPFSIDILVNGEKRRLAHNLPNRAGGYTFRVSLQGPSDVSPVPGSIMRVDGPVQFDWPPSAAGHFQVATSPEFVDLVVDSSVPSNHTTCILEAPSGDSVTYYWRILATGAIDAPIYPLTVYASPTDVTDDNPAVPADFALKQNYPNPFNPSTAISYSVPERSTVCLEVYSLLGELVATLVHEEKGTGSYTVNWNGTDGKGVKVSSGVYLYQLSTGTFRSSKRMVLLK